jgi:trigger factor
MKGNHMNTVKNHDLKVDVIDTQPCSVTLSIEIPRGEVTAETARVFDDLQKRAQVPGFRQGKAPMDLIRKNYAGTAREKIVENLIHRSVQPALTTQGIEPVNVPVVQEITFEFDTPCTFKMMTERHPQFSVTGYTGIKITRQISPVTAEKVTAALNTLRERNARLAAAAAETVAASSFVVVDYEAFDGEEALADVKTKGQMMDLSAPQTLPGFKDGLAGARKGETRKITVTFPADSPNKKLAGKNILFSVTVVDIKEKILPALDDEFAKDMGLQTVAELEGKVRESLEAEEKTRQQRAVEKQLIDALIEKNTFPVPESLVQEQLGYLLKRFKDYLRQQGMPDALIEKDQAQWDTKYRPEAERNVKISYILNAIATVENIVVAEADLTAELERMRAANPAREAEVETYFTEHKSAIASSMKEEKIFAFLLSKANVKEETQK